VAFLEPIQFKTNKVRYHITLLMLILHSMFDWKADLSITGNRSLYTCESKLAGLVHFRTSVTLRRVRVRVGLELRLGLG